MRVQLQRDASTGIFCKTIMDIGNGRMEIDESTQCITLPANFCKITESIDVIGAKGFPKHCTKLQKPSVAQYACYISSQKHSMSIPSTSPFSMEYPVKRQHISPSILWRIKMRLSTIQLNS
ncbi:hypothetical protein TNCV_4356401 [Trichonephila clavipes]|nr:hypothetical protein TNCV_4356401 [Trichonephila clavipes]